MSQTTFPSLRNDAQVATHSGWIEIPAALERAARCIPLCRLVQPLLWKLTVAPLRYPDPGAQLYHFVGNMTEEPSHESCYQQYQFPSLIADARDSRDRCAIAQRAVGTINFGPLQLAPSRE